MAKKGKILIPCIQKLGNDLGGTNFTRYQT
jgi:hypothetical protein